MAFEEFQKELPLLSGAHKRVPLHTPKSLTKSTSVEAKELLETVHLGPPIDHEIIIEELAETLTYCLVFVLKSGVDPQQTVRENFGRTLTRIPIDQICGWGTKI